jgi:hypothetical protein
MPAFKHDIPDGASAPADLIRRPSGLAPLETWSTNPRDEHPGVRPAASADASEAVRPRPIVTGTSNAEKKLVATRLNRTRVPRLVPSTML